MMVDETKSTARQIKAKSSLYLCTLLLTTYMYNHIPLLLVHFQLSLIIISWLLLYCDYYYTVAIIHMAIITMSINISWLFLHRSLYSWGYYSMAILTVAIIFVWLFWNLEWFDYNGPNIMEISKGFLFKYLKIA